MKKIKTESREGIPLEVEVSSNSVRAFRKEKPEIKVHGGKKGKAEEELEEKLAKKPVMDIWKTDADEFTVDFSAGFQRGNILGQTREDLTEEVDVPMYGGPDIESDKGWLEWIGLDPSSPYLDEFLGRTKSKKKLNEEVT